jgi:transcriptional regulator with XRE-family HTH domain
MPAPEPALKKFGANVRTKRDAKELSQEKLAELADLDRTYVSSVERGLRNISILSPKWSRDALVAGSRRIHDEGVASP